MATNYYTGTGGSDSNGGTSHADRWLTIQHALDTMTTSQPNILNCTGSETLSSSLSFATYGSPTTDNWLLMIGYTTVAGDGGIFALDGGTNELINDDSASAVSFSLFVFTNWGTGTAFSLDNDCVFLNCEADGEGSRTKFIDADFRLFLVNCVIHDIALSSGNAIQGQSGSLFMGNYFHTVSATSSDIFINCTQNAIAMGNVFNMNLSGQATAVAVRLNSDGSHCIGNSFYQDGTAGGIAISLPSSEGCIVLNNVIDGFIDGVNTGSGAVMALYGHNKFRSCTNDETLSGDVVINLGNNDALGADPFTTTGSADHFDDDFTIVAALKAIAFPAQMYNPSNVFGTRNKNFQDIGALQAECTGGGGGTVVMIQPSSGQLGIHES